MLHCMTTSIMNWKETNEQHTLQPTDQKEPHKSYTRTYKKSQFFILTLPLRLFNLNRVNFQLLQHAGNSYFRLSCVSTCATYSTHLSSTFHSHTAAEVMDFFFGINAKQKPPSYQRQIDQGVYEKTCKYLHLEHRQRHFLEGRNGKGV